MGDDDFNLDELINAHSARVVEKDEDKSLDDFENIGLLEESTDNTVEDKGLDSITETTLDYESTELSEKSAEDLLDYELSDELDFDQDINLDDNLMLLDPLEGLQRSNISEILTLSDYSRYVINKIEGKNLPTTPENYQIYFTEFIQAQNNSLQESIYKLLDKESFDVEQQKSKEFEDSVNKSLKLTQQLLNITTKVHGNIHIMRNIIYKRDNELTNRNSGDIIKLLKFDLSKLENILKKQSGSMKNIYSRSVEAANIIQEKIIFDSKFGVYNRKYFLESLENEIQKIKYFNYQSSIALIIPNKALTSQHLTSKVAFIISKTISKILQETFKRNDIVAYYGNGIFSVLVTHSDINQTKEKIKILFTALDNSALFISEKEVNIKVKVGISDFDSNIKVSKSLLKALDALKIANNSSEDCHIL